MPIPQPQDSTHRHRSNTLPERNLNMTHHQAHAGSSYIDRAASEDPNCPPVDQLLFPQDHYGQYDIPIHNHDAGAFDHVDPTSFEYTYARMQMNSFSPPRDPRFSSDIRLDTSLNSGYQQQHVNATAHDSPFSPEGPVYGFSPNASHPIYMPPLIPPSPYEPSTRHSSGQLLGSPTTPSPETPSSREEPPLVQVHSDTESLSISSSPQSQSSLTEKKKKVTPQEQYALWKNAHISESCVPQPMYKPHTIADRKRYIEAIDLEEPIHFELRHPRDEGISMSDALSGKCKRLESREDSMFEGRGPSVSIRVEWPGYRSWSRQIPTKDFRSPPGPVTRAKLAKNVSKCLDRFIKDNTNKPMEDDGDPMWKVGPGHITIDDLVLVSLHHVSMGSWQPCIRLNRQLQQLPSSSIAIGSGYSSHGYNVTS